MRFEVLGPLRVRLGGEVLALGGPKPRTLLGMLLLHPGEPVGIEELTEALWDGEPPVSAAVNVRAYVRTLRRALDPAGGADGDHRVQTRPPGYLIRVEAGELDLLDFRDLDAHGRQALDRGDTAAAARRWRQALDLWRGRPLADVRGGPRLDAAVVRLHERRLRVAEAWIDAQLELGAHAEVVAELRGLVAAEPLHESLWARLMVALHRTGRSADALVAFGHARQHLVEELGVEPGRQLQRLQRAILTGDAVVGLDDAPPVPVPSRTRPPPADAPPDPAAAPRGPHPAAGRAPAAEVCPYRGLVPFETVDAAWFFGRERLVAELAAYLSSQVLTGHDSALLAVVGPSGSGKSSLLRAGLLPALADGLVPAAKDWPRVVLTPGPHPLATLRAAVASVQVPGTAPPQPESLADPRQLGTLVRRALGPDPGDRRVVMVVDQLEELFTLCKDERERQAFVTALRTAGAAGGPQDPPAAVVVLGLRADFYGHCIAYPELLPVFSGSQVVVGPMTEAELRHAIERPAARAGLTLEPGLVEMLLADLGRGSDGGLQPEPGSLPLLSHALLATWQLRDGDRLTVAGYRTAGGMHGAVATTAETVYGQLDPGARAVVRQLFTRLVALGEGTDDTRRRISYDELLGGRAPADAAAARDVLDTLAHARLIVLSAGTIEVAHEALITHWPRLQGWLNEDREGLRTHRQLTDAAQTWASLGRDPGALYRGARLVTARQWAGRDGGGDDLNALEREFLDASAALEAAEGAAARRRTVRFRQMAAGILVLVLLAAGGGALALRASRDSAEQERVARSQDLATRALDLPEAQHDTAKLVAVEAYRTAPTPQARAALASLAGHADEQDEIPVTGGDTVRQVAFSPDGRWLAASDGSSQIDLWEAGSREHVATLEANGYSYGDLVFSPDGEWLAWSGWVDVVVFKLPLGEDGYVLEALDRPEGSIAGEGGLTTLGFNPDGTRLFGADSYHETLLVWNLEDGTHTERRIPALESATLSPDGTVLATSTNDGALSLWDYPGLTQETPVRAAGSDEFAPEAVFSPDGKTLLVIDGASVTWWDVASQTASASLPRATPAGTPPMDAVLAPDERLIALADTEKVALLDLPGRSPWSESPLGEIFPEVAFSTDGTVLAMTAGDGVRMWDLDPERTAARFCAAAGRSLTEEEWAGVAPGRSYHAMCG